METENEKTNVSESGSFCFKAIRGGKVVGRLGRAETIRTDDHV
jgi:hypothetical protein